MNDVNATSLLGVPVYLRARHEVFSESSCDPGSKIGIIDARITIDAIDIQPDAIKLEYGQSYGYVKNEEVLYGKELETFVLQHLDYFDRKATIVSDSAYLFATDDSGAFAVASQGEQFIVLDVDKQFVKVSFDNREAYVCTSDVSLSYFVQVADYRTIKLRTDIDTRQQIVNYAIEFVGNPYVWGGTSLTNGADCSGFVQAVLSDFNIDIPRCSIDQSSSGKSVTLDKLQPGDLVFYNRGASIGHVAMYIGNGKVVHVVTLDTTFQQLFDLNYTCENDEKIVTPSSSSCMPLIQDGSEARLFITVFNSGNEELPFSGCEIRRIGTDVYGTNVVPAGMDDVDLGCDVDEALLKLGNPDHRNTYDQTEELEYYGEACTLELIFYEGRLTEIALSKNRD